MGKRTTLASSLFVGVLSVAGNPFHPTATAFVRSGDRASPKRASVGPPKSTRATPLPLSFVSRWPLGVSKTTAPSCEVAVGFPCPVPRSRRAASAGLSMFCSDHLGR